MIKFIPLLLCLLSVNLHGGQAEVQQAIRKVQQLPEAHELMQKIQEEGPMAFSTSDHPIVEKFGAVWDTDRRLILLPAHSESTEGELIGSILFEMHNASSSSQFAHLEKLVKSRQITREQYIEAMEYLEFVNSKKCALLAQKGIEKGVFPSSARLPTYRDFQEHFHYQKVSGHSKAVGQIYDQILRESN